MDGLAVVFSPVSVHLDKMKCKFITITAEVAALFSRVLLSAVQNVCIHH